LKTAFSTNGNSIDDDIEPAFGRCKNFLIVDSQSGEVTVAPNPGFSAAGGAGVRAAQALTGLGVDKLVTGSVGINARPLSDDAGIAAVTGECGSILERKFD
jgi:predicted Fe-Mo cluster-binding NifX family protein